MELSEIKRLGNFDDLVAEGVVSPLYKSGGIKLSTQFSLSENLDTFNDCKYNSICKIHFTLSGVIYGNYELKYPVAWADILILKGRNHTPVNVENDGRRLVEFRRLSKTPDEYELYSVAFAMSRAMGDKDVAIVNKVYVSPNFRKLGINRWIHDNIFDIINIFSFLEPNIVILQVGDFNNESRNFGLSAHEYYSFLRAIYRKLGYKSVGLITKLQIKVLGDNILFKSEKQLKKEYLERNGNLDGITIG